MQFASFLESAVRGAAARIARRLQVTPVTVSDWATGKKQIPVERCPAIEVETGGVVSCEDARPDVAWCRVADSEWKWHPRGRPLLDVAAGANRATVNATASEASHAA